MNYMSLGIGRHYIIWRDITTKLYIVHYGNGIEEIVKYCDNTSKTELDTFLYSRSKMCQTMMHIYANIFFNELHAYGYRPALHN